MEAACNTRVVKRGDRTVSRLVIFGATGTLGREVLRQALIAGHDVTVFVRTPSRLRPEATARVRVCTGDLNDSLPVDVVRGQDVVINCAGHVRDGHEFVNVVDRIAGTVEGLPSGERPVCLFLAGAALLQLDSSGRRGVDLPKVKTIYWPHQVNFDRLQSSALDWRLLCPGPMVDGPAIGRDRVRMTLDRFPAAVPSIARSLPDFLLLPMFASMVAQVTIPYADAAAVILANMDRPNAMSRRRVGLALPAGMRRSPGR
jgi:putative NADH-flavin reductase